MKVDCALTDKIFTLLLDKINLRIEESNSIMDAYRDTDEFTEAVYRLMCTLSSQYGKIGVIYMLTKLVVTPERHNIDQLLQEKKNG